MRRFLTAGLSSAAMLAAATRAYAQAVAAGAPDYNLSWAALDPGDDWSAKVILSLFPVSDLPPGADQPGSASTVVGTLLGTITGFVAALVMVWICYALIMQIFRGAETGRLMDRGMSAMFLVRMGMAAIIMFPLASGFSFGQKLIVGGSMWGAGMARTVYNAAVQAIGPDSMVVAQPMVPGTKTIVSGLIDNELCRALVNEAAAQPNLVPIPKPVESIGPESSGYTTWAYTLSTGNGIGGPVCGTVTLNTPKLVATNIAGVGVDMTKVQRDTLTYVLTNDIRPVVERVANRFWMTKRIDELQPLVGVLTTAANDYTARLTKAATDKTRELRTALQDATEARKGNVGLIENQVQLSSLGWTSAGAYYLEFARLNGQTLSLMNATPKLNPPSYQGLGQSLSRDLAPLVSSSKNFMVKLMTYVRTTDGLDMPGGNADLFTGATPGEDGASAIDKVFRSLRLNERVLSAFTENLSPTGNMWTDPFSALMAQGHKMVAIALTALGLAGLMSSDTGTAFGALASVATGNFAAAGVAVVGNMVVNFLATPIFTLCMALLLPGLTIAFVLPMIPWLTFFAGVIGWIILVCEAVIAIPFAMLAHMTFGGEGLHGRAREIYSLLFSILMRPSLMIVGLFLGGALFTAGSWLIRQSFGIAAGFVLANGFLATNVLGVAVLLIIYVLAHTVTALLCFRMISLVPHHVTRMAGFGSANRVDMDQFGRDAALIGAGAGLRTISRTGQTGIKAAGDKRLETNRQRQLPGPNNTGDGARTDTTLRAATDMPSENSRREEADE